MQEKEGALRDPLPWAAPLALGALLLAAVAALQVAWTARNGVPDGAQNEFIHLGNAYDLWEVVQKRDPYWIKYHLTTNYWPPGFYLWPFGAFALAGMGHLPALLSQLGFLGILLFSVQMLGETLQDRRTGMLAQLAVVAMPSITGNLLRFEPNVGVCAFVTLGLWLLHRSGEKAWALGAGVALGLGLLTDRLSAGVFLFFPWLFSRNRHLSALMALAVAGWWYAHFAQEGLAEILGQTGGEVDSAGETTELRDPWALSSILWYPLTLLDGQAGLALGASGLAALALRGGRLPKATVLGGLLLFTLIQKKQAYYTVPMLGALAVLLARLPPPVVLGALALGFVQLDARLWGRPWDLRLPTSWVEPIHPQAAAPRGLAPPVAEVAAAMKGRRIFVFSEDTAWFEGFAILHLREALPGATVQGVVGNPTAVVESFGEAEALLVITPAAQGDAWPSTARIEAQMRQFHYGEEEAAATAATVDGARARFAPAASWPWGEEGRVDLFLVR